MKYITPIINKDGYADSVERLIVYSLYNTTYKPLFDILGVTPKKQNKAGDLKSSLEKGIVTYDKGVFKGTFSAAISKELRSIGAQFDRGTKSFRIDPTNLPLEYKMMIQKTSEAQSYIIGRIKEQLNRSIDMVPPYINLDTYAGAITADLNKQFAGGMARVQPGINTPMEMTGYVSKRIDEEYTENINLSIRDWTLQHTTELRNKVVGLVAEGYRSDKIASVIQADYGVAQRKAKFIAKQETGLLVAKYRESRYTAAGITQYKWLTVGDNRVRHDHRLLDGHIFNWGEAVIDSRTGQTGNPGEAFGCRCTAKAILD